MKKRLLDILIQYSPNSNELIPALENCKSLSVNHTLLLDLIKAEEGLISSSEVIRKLKDLDFSKFEADLIIYILGVWGQLSIIDSNWDELKIIEQQAKSYATSKTAPEILSRIFLLEAYIYSVEKRFKERDAAFQKAFKGLKKNSLFYGHLMSTFIYYYSIDGRFHEIPEKIRFLENHVDKRFQNIHKICSLFNYSITGNTKKALAQVDEVESLVSQGSFPYSMGSYKRCRYLLDLMLLSQRQETTQYLEKNIEWDKKNRHESDFSFNWVNSVLCLMKKDIDGALKEARAYTNELSIVQRFKGDEFCLIRAEIVAGNVEAASRLLSNRMSKGLNDHLDLFFLTRCYLMEGQKEKAHNCFKRFVSRKESFNSEGRFFFELSLSLELSPKEIFELGGFFSSKNPVDKLEKDTLGIGFIKNSPSQNALDSIITKNRNMILLKDTIIKLSNSEVSVLISGETGTGKELFAKAIHENSSRKSHPFLSINCGAISNSLIASELFGHKKGAFSGAIESSCGLFEAAGEGTIFLDEIGEISSELQKALLRILESGEYRPVGDSKTKKIKCRVLSATNADLYKSAKNGTFREDLIYRLEQFEIKIPPIRDRKEDILPLIYHFFNTDRPAENPVLIKDSLELELKKRKWPGNVREIKNYVEKLKILNSNKSVYSLSDDEFNRPLIKSEIPTLTIDNENLFLERKEEDLDLKDKWIKKYLKNSNHKSSGKQKIIELFKNYKELKGIQISHILNLPPHTVSRYVSELCIDGIVEKRNNTASPRTQYFTYIEDSET